MGNFMLTQIQVKFMVINLRNYMLGVFQVTSHTMRCQPAPFVHVPTLQMQLQC